jgi:hypothetical protein
MAPRSAALAGARHGLRRRLAVGGLTDRLAVGALLALAVAGCALLALLATGCAASPPHNPVAPGYAGAEAVHKVLLFPLDAVTPLPIEVADEAVAVEQELRAYLEAHGKTVETWGTPEAREAWLQSVAAVLAERGAAERSSEDAARVVARRAAHVLARRLREERDFDALVIPSIVMRQAELGGPSTPAREPRLFVSWDGVQRSFRTVNPQHGRSEVISSGISGTIPVPSLHVLVLSTAGEWIFEGTGGLDVVHEARLDRRTIGAPQWRIVPRPAIFRDRALLREGISVAFDPFLPRTRPRRGPQRTTPPSRARRGSPRR